MPPPRDTCLSSRIFRCSLSTLASRWGSSVTLSNSAGANHEHTGSLSCAHVQTCACGDPLAARRGPPRMRSQCRHSDICIFLHTNSMDNSLTMGWSNTSALHSHSFTYIYIYILLPRMISFFGQTHTITSIAKRNADFRSACV